MNNDQNSLITFWTANIFFKLHQDGDNISDEFLDYALEEINTKCLTEEDANILDSLLSYHNIENYLAPYQCSTYIIEHLNLLSEQRKAEILWAISFFTITRASAEEQLAFVEENMINISNLVKRQITDLMSIALSNGAWVLVQELLQYLAPSDLNRSIAEELLNQQQEESE